MNFRFGLVGLTALLLLNNAGFGLVKIGLNYPETGPYAGIGLDQLRAMTLAVDIINMNGGVAGQRLVLVTRDSKAKPDTALANATDMIQADHILFLTGGVSSRGAVAIAQQCQEHHVLYMPSMPFLNDITDKSAKPFMFRPGYYSWMAARALGAYLSRHYEDATYFYVTEDDTWGWSTEEALRAFTKTRSTREHPRLFADEGQTDFSAIIRRIQAVKPTVVVAVLAGPSLRHFLKQVTIKGLKRTIQFAAPSIELSQAESAGPSVMEGVLSTTDFTWQIPFKYRYKAGRRFVEAFRDRYNRYPDRGAAIIYTSMMEWKAAVERARSFQAERVKTALEGHRFTLLKDEQEWRAFDHQNMQSVYVVRCHPTAVVVKDPLGLDFFDILDRVPGEYVVPTRSQWNAVRKANHLPPEIQ